MCNARCSARLSTSWCGSLVELNRSGAPRLAGPDVTRAVALIGIVIMNFHGYLNGGQEHINRSYAERAFDTYDGPLSTRFAATFVLVAGMGVTLLTNRSRMSGDKTAINDNRWRHARRGLLLFVFGLLIEWIWPGTILFFYGAYFMVAALLFTLRLRWLALIGTLAALAGAGIARFRLERTLDGRSTAWLDPPVNSPRNLVLRTFVGYTHPLLPWLAFLCAGIALGRYLPSIVTLRPKLIALGSACPMRLLVGRRTVRGRHADPTVQRRRTDDPDAGSNGHIEISAVDASPTLPLAEKR